MFGFRKYGKLRGGRRFKSWRRNVKPFSSFVSLSSRARVIPSKRRKFDAISRENDEDASVSVKPPQNQNSLITSLSNVRFKDISSSVFDYHHFVRRFNGSSLSVIAGGPGTTNYSGQTFTFSQIPDYTEIAALYSRYRFTRVVIEVIPKYTPQTLYTWGSQLPPTLYHRIYRGNDSAMSTEVRALTDNDAVCHEDLKPFSISFTPSTTVDNDMKESGATSSLNVIEAPWIRTSETGVFHYGVEFLPVNNSTFAQGLDIWKVNYTVWFDVADAGL